jgi:hypothetical protein
VAGGQPGGVAGGGVFGAGEPRRAKQGRLFGHRAPHGLAQLLGGLVEPANVAEDDLVATVDGRVVAIRNDQSGGEAAPRQLRDD